MSPADGADSPAAISLGEVLIDFVALEGASLDGAETFRRAAGGAPANVAVGLVRLGVPAAFIGKVSGDAFGRFLRRTLADEGVDVRGLIEDPAARTPLAFVGAAGRGGRGFVFYHDGMADTLLTPEDIDTDLIGRARTFHFGSVTLAAEPSASATLAAARSARARGCLVSFDPNVRLELWDAADRARTTILDALGLADLVKVSNDEIEFLCGTTDPAEACRALRAHGPWLAVVTLGADGCYYDAGDRAGHVPGVHVQAVDTLGAGDAFMAGLLMAIGSDRDQDLTHGMRFANAAGALATTLYGAIPALPTRAQVERLLA